MSSKQPSASNILFFLSVLTLIFIICCIICMFEGLKFYGSVISQYTIGLFMIFAGVGHFNKDMIPMMVATMPPYLPYHLQLIYISGIIEILSGLLIMYPLTTPYGAYLIITTVIGVYPANIHMYLNRNVQKKLGWSQQQTNVRMVLQITFIGLAYLSIR